MRGEACPLLLFEGSPRLGVHGRRYDITNEGKQMEQARGSRKTSDDGIIANW